MAKNVFDLEAFIAFARKQTGNYRYSDPGGCAASQFLTYRTGRQVNCGDYYWRFSDESGEENHKRFTPELSYALISYPRSWSALADRLEALL